MPWSGWLGLTCAATLLASAAAQAQAMPPTAASPRPGLPTLGPQLAATPMRATKAEPQGVAGPASADARAVTISFRAEVNGQPFRCGKTYRNVGTAHSVWEPEDLRLYVSEVTVLTPGPTGCNQEASLSLLPISPWQQADVALLDFEDRTGLCQNGTPATRDVVIGDVSAAAAKAMCGLRFVVGVPAKKNHADASTALAPLDQAGLFWGWAAGYKFFTLDGRVAKRAGHSMHLGSEGCELGPHGRVATCSTPNRAVVTLPQFSASRHDVVLDVGALLQDSDLSRTADGHHNGCMGEADNPACRAMYDAFGLRANTLPATGAGPDQSLCTGANAAKAAHLGGKAHRAPRPLFAARPKARSK